MRPAGRVALPAAPPTASTAESPDASAPLDLKIPHTFLPTAADGPSHVAADQLSIIRGGRSGHHVRADDPASRSQGLPEGGALVVVSRTDQHRVPGPQEFPGVLVLGRMTVVGDVTGDQDGV